MALKPVRVTSNIPAELQKLVDQRVREEHYHSISAYIVGLIMFDLYSRRPHWLTGALMKEPQWVRDQVVMELVRDFDAPKGEGWFEKRITEIIAERKRKEQHEARAD